MFAVSTSSQGKNYNEASERSVYSGIISIPKETTITMTKKNSEPILSVQCITFRPKFRIRERALLLILLLPGDVMTQNILLNGRQRRRRMLASTLDVVRTTRTAVYQNLEILIAKRKSGIH